MWISLQTWQPSHCIQHAQKVIRDYSSEGKNVIPLIKDDHWGGPAGGLVLQEKTDVSDSRIVLGDGQPMYVS